MRKKVQAFSLTILSVVAGLSSLSVSAQESTVLYEQSFDDLALEEGVTLPDGWVSNTDNAFNVVNGDEWGLSRIQVPIC